MSQKADLGLVRRLKNHLRQYRLLYSLYVNARFFAHVAREGLWKAAFVLSPGADRAREAQRPLVWSVAFPYFDDPASFAGWLGEHGVRVHQEGRHTFYIPPQQRLKLVIPGIVGSYPEGAGFKVLRDFRSPDQATYLSPESRFAVRKLIELKPQEQVIAANFLYVEGLGPRVLDICCWKSAEQEFTVFVVEHVEGERPSEEQWREFIGELERLAAESLLRCTIPDWKREADFACPDCNRNLVKPAEGRAAQYVDFQNFMIADPRKWTREVVDRGKDHWHFGGGRVLRGERYLYQSIPGVSGTGKRNISKRWKWIVEELSKHGVDLAGRVVLDIGCNAGMILHAALAAGAAWGLGWDLPELIPHTRGLLYSLGATRFDLTGGELDPTYALDDDVPEFLKSSLSESVIFYLSVVQHIGVLESLERIPWRALVFEGHQGERLEGLPGVLEPLMQDGVRAITSTYMIDGDSGRRPLMLLLRG